MVLKSSLKSKYSVRNSSFKKKNVHFKIGYSTGGVHAEYNSIFKDKLKSGNSLTTQKLLSNPNNVVEKQISELVKLGPDYYPSWITIGLFEKQKRIRNFRKMISLKNKKLLNKCIEALCINKEMKKQNNYSYY